MKLDKCPVCGEYLRDGKCRVGDMVNKALNEGKGCPKTTYKKGDVKE